jgi:branched-chain amino acid transport system permease protein
VLSFGHISFVAVGAFFAGVMTIPLESKTAVLPDLFPILGEHTVGNVPSLILGALLGGALAFLIGLPLMRLSGLAASIATFAVLQIAYNVLSNWTSIGPGQTALSLVPETTHGVQAVIGVLIVIVIAFAYQQSRLGRLLRASREDAAAAEGVGINVHRQRLWAFTLSGALAGFSGALYVHMLGSILASSVYLDLTFLTLAMLVVGGATSLWGATLGALLVSGLDSFLSQAEAGVHVGFRLDLPQGSTLVVLGAAMALVLILRPSGITGGREFAIPRMRRTHAPAPPVTTEGTTP